MIRLDGVVKNYGGTRIGPVSLELPPGGIVALVGPNGAGKSTVLTMIGRLLAPDEGTVTIDGLDVHRTPSRRIARVVSILRQENHFVTRLTVRQLVGFGRYPYSAGRLTTHDEDKISAAIDLLDLTALEQRFLDQLSGGQRQRAYVAMVLAQDTDYVLLDEPLNNLDAEHSVQMMTRLRHAADALGRTIVIVLHDINFAAAYSDYIVAMEEGVVAEHGTPAEIIRDDVLTRVFPTPVTVIDGPTGPVAVYHRTVGG
ncbi:MULTISPECIES: iron ABC transporter ATP-binding protein [unclassified Microbacterium]|uniref:iron ABC transporter ATP-binding protein n=1 Tax=unclassified Microbacterium TaxID=2609290 RepID=UPI00301ACC4E